MAGTAVRGLHPLVQGVAGSIIAINADIATLETQVLTLQEIVGGITGGSSAGGQTGSVQFRSTSGGLTGNADLIFDTSTASTGNGTLAVNGDVEVAGQIRSNDTIWAGQGGFNISGNTVLATPVIGSVRIGYNATVLGRYCTSAGYASLAGNTTDGFYASAYGFRCEAEGNASIAIGATSFALETNSISIGFASSASNVSSTCIGNRCNCFGAYAISIGDNAIANNLDSVSIGHSAFIGPTAEVGTGGTGGPGELGATSVSIGAYSVCGMNNSVAIGAYSQVAPADTNDTGATSTVVGYGSIATVGGTVVMGAGSSSSHNNTVVLGNLAFSTSANQIALPDGMAVSGGVGLTGESSPVSFAGMTTGSAASSITVSIGGVEYLIPLYLKAA